METVIDSVEVKGGSFLIVLRDNPFHLSGGGQPGGRGSISGDNFELRVEDCRGKGDVSVITAKLIKGAGDEVIPGSRVEVQVDLDWQAWVARMHSGEHALSRALERNFQGLRVFKVNIGEEEGLITLDYPEDLTWDKLWIAEEEANRVVNMDLAVRIEELTGDQALQDEALKANWERLQLDMPDSIRVVSLGGYDRVACCGLHVESTSQIGGVLVTGFKGSPSRWEVRYTVEPVRSALLDRWSRVVRRFSRDVGCQPEELEKVYGAVKEDAKSKAKLLERLRPFLVFPMTKVCLDGLSVFVVDLMSLGDLPSEMMTHQLRAKGEEDPRSISIGVCVSGGANRFAICRGGDVALDLCKWLRDNRDLGLKGGGSPDWVSGVFGDFNVELWIDRMKGEL
jgi:alanyl-tRNA synthetase